MLRALAHNGLMIASLVVGSTVTGVLAIALRNARGTLGPLVFAADAPVVALLAVVGAVLLGTVLAIVVTRTSNAAIGLFVLGGTLFGLAWRTAGVEELAHGGSLFGAVVEDLVWAVLVAGAAAAIFRIGGPLPDVEPDADGRTPSPYRSVDGLRCIAGALAVLPTVWLVAQTTTKGQVIGAAFCGGMVAGLVGRLLAPHVQPVLLASAALVVAAIGHAWVALRIGGDLSVLAADGAIPALARPMPAQYAAGAVMGVAVGLGWAKSFLHHED